MLVLARNSGSDFKKIWHYLFWWCSAFCMLNVCINVWEDYFLRSHISLESPTLPEHSCLNCFISMQQRSSFISDKSTENIWNSGKRAHSVCYRCYPSCQNKTMTKQCGISKSFDAHPEIMAAGLSVRRSNRLLSILLHYTWCTAQHIYNETGSVLCQ